MRSSQERTEAQQHDTRHHSQTLQQGQCRLSHTNEQHVLPTTGSHKKNITLDVICDIQGVQQPLPLVHNLPGKLATQWQHHNHKNASMQSL